MTQVARSSLGNTGIKVSLLGLGTVKFGRNEGVKYPNSFELPDDDRIRRLLEIAQDLGVNVLDTSPAYGTSERRIGRLLKDRSRWVLITKFGENFKDGTSFFDFRPEQVGPSLEHSLQELQTDYVDVLLIHSDGRDEMLLSDGTLDALIAQRKRGLVRAVGISSKSASGLRAAIDAGCDVAMATLNRDYEDEADTIVHAGRAGVGVLIKKALASGHRPTGQLGWVADHPGVSSIVVGTINELHLRANAEQLAENRETSKLGVLS